VIGTGPSGPENATLKALDTIKKMDFIITDERHAKLFGDYIGKTPLLFDPWKGRWDYQGKPYSQLSKEERAKYHVERFKGRDRNVARIKELMAQGKNVGLLDSGNPCLFGPSHWYVEHFDPAEVVIIPGMGCDAAAMAALKRSTIPAHGALFVVQTAPMFLADRAVPNPDMQFDTNSAQGQQALKDIAKHEHTLILYMALRDPVKLFKTLGKYLPADLPAACVFWAGHPDKERVVRGTVGDMGPKLAEDKERFMGLLLIGRFLEGQPYEKAMRRHRPSEN
jgi:precorrin-4 methylase